MKENKGKSFEHLATKLEQAANDFWKSLKERQEVLVLRMKLETILINLETKLQMLNYEIYDIEQKIERKETNPKDAKLEKEKIRFKEGHIKKEIGSIKYQILNLHEKLEQFESLEGFYKECKMENLHLCCDVFSKLSLDTPVEVFRTLATLDKVVKAEKQEDKAFEKMEKRIKALEEEGESLVQKIKLKKEERQAKKQQELDDIKEKSIVIESQQKAKNLKERILKKEDISNEEIKESIDLWTKGIEFLLKRQT